MKLLCIDNYDSFTFNLVHYLAETGADVRVVRNDEITTEDVQRLAEDRAIDGIVISPGPSTPEDAGITVDVIDQVSGLVPILGVCLGHQAIGHAFGGRIKKSSEIVHGKATPVHHANLGLFEGLPSPIACGRYHSLIVERESLPDSLEITAWSDRGEIMGLRHKTLDVEGVQFHPESILTELGKDLLRAWITRGAS
jgi:anthranilate synthase component 2